VGREVEAPEKGHHAALGGLFGVQVSPLRLVSVQGAHVSAVVVDDAQARAEHGKLHLK